MRKLQNNFTTPEQSKLLLELGVPADSADSYYSNVIKHITVFDEEIDKKEFFNGKVIPCWSVGRLIELSDICYTSLFEQEYYIRQKDCNTDYLVNLFELAANSMDFSKLDDKE